MDAIAACFIGGTAVTGGIGTIPGAVIGAFVMGVINQGLSIMGVDTAVVKTIKGLVLLLAVAVDIMSKRQEELTFPFLLLDVGFVPVPLVRIPPLLSAVILVTKDFFLP